MLSQDGELEKQNWFMQERLNFEVSDCNRRCINSGT